MCQILDFNNKMEANKINLMQRCCNIYPLFYICNIFRGNLNKKVLHIAISAFLITNLLFSQLVINLLHDRHDAHEPAIELEKGQAALQRHGEHCKICSLDIVFNLFENPPPQLETQQQNSTLITSCAVNEKFVLVSFSQDRAPPFFA
jgi:hypothetical protein